MSAKDVFISYHMNSSTDIVEKISAALEGVGISSWYAKQDIEGSYAGAIIDAIRECKVFLLILNRYSNMSAHCLNEINAVFDRYSRREQVVILPFRIDKCEMSKDVYYYLGRIRMFDGSLPPEMERVGELVDRISNILGREQAVEASFRDVGAREEKRYRLVGATISKDNSFIGRKAELELIHEKLSQHPHELILVGMGGIGKSQIAKAYCDLYRQDYDVVMWVSFDTSLKKTVVNDFAFPVQGLDRSDYPGDDEDAYFRRKLRVLREIAGERVLFVIDNFDVTEDPDLEAFCQGNYSVLFTTRYREVCGDVPEYEIREFTDKDEMLQLFRLERKKILDSEAEAIDRLLELLDGHPLSIRVVASAMNSNRISPEKMIALLEAYDSSDSKGAKAIDLVRARLNQVFSVAALTEEEQAILKNLALMPLGGVEVETFYDWCEFEDYEVIDGLIRKGWVVHDSAADAVHLHPIINNVMTEKLRQDPSCCDRMLDNLQAATKGISAKPFETRRKVFECVDAAARKLPENHPKKCNMLWKQAYLIAIMSRYDEATVLMRRVLEMTEDRELKLAIINEIAHNHVLTGRQLPCIEEAEKGLALLEGIPLEELSSAERSQRRNLYTRLNESYRGLGRLDDAEKCMREVLADEVRFPEDMNDDQLGWYYLHLGRVLSYKGNRTDWEESGACFDESIQHFRACHHSSAEGYTYMFYGQLRMYEGAFEEALRMNAQAQKMMEPVIGTQHTDIGKLKLFEANIYRAKGDEATALACYRKAEEMMLQRGNELLAQKVREVMDSGKVGYTN